MANTTFKGPVRSQNGFQELVDGVWTPVGGGGGGGGSAIVVPVTLGAYQTVVVPKPADFGATLSYVGPILDRNSVGTGTTFTLAPTSGYYGLTIAGVSTTEDSGVQRISASGPNWNKDQTGWIAWYLTLTYMQDYVDGGNTYAVFWANYSAYNP
jgi:hypothetical protein